MSTMKIPMLVGTVLLAGLNSLASGQTPETIAAAGGGIIIHPINHATFVMEHGGTTIYVDPVGGADVFSSFDPPDVILITHIHGDHTSAETVAGVSTDQTLILAPTTVADELGSDVNGDLTIIANGESYTRPGLEVEAIPAYNLSEERLGFHPRERGDNAYLVTIGGTRIFISGDTEDTPEMRALENIDAAFLCMNLPYTMTVERAADATLAFAPKVVYPYHYRGKGGMSDLEAFKTIVAADPEIEVRLLQWY